MEVQEYQAMEEIENSHAWFLAKYRYLELVMDAISLKEGATILDVGCGTGAVMKKLGDAGYAVQGVDSSEEALKYCRQKNLRVFQGAADSLPFADNHFDVVISLDMLEHILDDRQAVKEMHRVLKVGGYLIATVPAHRFLWSAHDEFLHHVRRYSKSRFLSLFDQGFDILLGSWLHACILLPTIALRLLKKAARIEQTQSESKPLGRAVNKFLKIVYLPEMWFFDAFGFLPFGLSLIVVAQKK